jgi:hypothetical protein
MKYLLVFVLALFSFGAVAAPATADLSWTAPDTRVDGTILEASEIAEYRVFYSVDGTIDGSGDYVTVSGASAEQVISLELEPRPEPYVVTFAVRTVTTDGLESVLSESISKTFQVDSTATPAAPTSLYFSISCVDGCTVTEVTGE